MKTKMAVKMPAKTAMVDQRNHFQKKFLFPKQDSVKNSVQSASFQWDQIALLEH